MAAIKLMSRTVYYAPTKRRHYLTLKAAANKEAGAMIQRKYPTEAPSAEDFDNGWHWMEDERLRLVHARLMRRLIRRFRGST